MEPNVANNSPPQINQKEEQAAISENSVDGKLEGKSKRNWSQFFRKYFLEGMSNLKMEKES
jgi:hypothetical protein